ncbi:MAG TPA: hypothetical protein VIX17_05455 [Pyrinomonadaceae bacterium]|jgi:hypothetical protein
MKAQSEARMSAYQESLTRQFLGVTICLRLLIDNPPRLARPMM